MGNLKTHFSYQKFAEPPYKILYLDDDYFLQKESIAALRALGHEVIVVDVIHNAPKMMEKLLKTAVLTRPDCVMSVNHTGFDPEGKIAHILSELAIPTLMWYVDDFRFIILESGVQANSCTAVFTFERQHLQPLRDCGFSHVFYLPTATVLDPQRDYTHSEFQGLGHATVFIGSTFNKSKKARLKPRFPHWVDELAQQVDFTRLHDRLFAMIETRQRHLFSRQKDFFHYASYVMCHATGAYRRHWLEHVRAENFHVFGDRDWESANIKGKIHNPVHNQTVAPHIYCMSLINLCLSSQQLGRAVSLRAFDIPAAGGFMLTDWKEDLAELFDADKEIVSFGSVEEMNDKIGYYQRHPEKRLPIVARARRRVIAEHQVIHRMRKMLETAAKIW